MGLFLGVFYERRKTLLAPMLLHGCHNFIVALTAFWLMTQAAHAPLLGISGEETEDGYRITHVYPGYGGEEADLRPGDIVVQVDDEPVRTLTNIRRTLRPRKPGEHVRVHFLRAGQPLEVNVELRARQGP
jgi:S1-C subfamily serine protease